MIDPAAAGVRAASVVIYVGGADRDCRHDGRDHGNGDDGGRTVAHFGDRGIVQANVVAPNGTVWLQSNTQATGAFIGAHVRVGERATLTLDSAFK